MIEQESNNNMNFTDNENLNMNDDNSISHNHSKLNNSNVQQASNLLDNKYVSNVKQERVETATVWELEVWKKSEQTKFKAYLKQIEIDYMNKIADEIQLKEEKREKDFKLAIGELQSFINKAKKKTHELENRENKISLIEEEIKLKLNEMTRQINFKNEEITIYQKKSKDEKTLLEKEINSLKKQLVDKNNEIEQIEKSFRLFKKEIEESPISNIRIELNKKMLEVEESNREKERLTQENSKLKQNINKLKEDFISLKKVFDNEKEQLYKQKLEEIEKLKFEIYNQKQSSAEFNELTNIKDAIHEMKNKDTADKSRLNKIKKQYKIVSLERNSSKGNHQGTNSGNFNNLYDAELERLSTMRSQLLSTGQYTENDKLIIGIDDQIRKIYQSKI